MIRGLRSLATFALFAGALLFLPSAASAQVSHYTSIGLGYVQPTGDFGDTFDPSYTLRGQLGFSVASLASIHAQAGLNHYKGVDIRNDIGLVEVRDQDVFHVAAGARIGTGMFWVGGNAGIFFEEGDSSYALFPEVGVGVSRFEIIADTRLSGDETWFAVRAAMRF